MSARRMWWAGVSPVVWMLHRAGRCSYKWANVCHGARHPDRFDALWQHQWYGEPIPALPDELTLCGIGYTTAVAEGTVTFLDPFTRTRITFDRDPHDRLAALWTVTLSGTTSIPASHVRSAYEWVCAVFGGSHDLKSPALVRAPQRVEAEQPKQERTSW